MASHFRTLQVKDIRHETADCVSIAFVIPEEFREEFRFKQGQNITIRSRVGGEELRRSYSICSSPLEDELRIAVKKVADGRFSVYANEILKQGEELEILPPTGKFYTELDPTQARNYLAVAAGSGITPILSLIKTTLAVEPHSTFTLVYGNRYRPSIIFREELEALKNKYMSRFVLHHILSREKVEMPLHQGRIDPAKFNELSEKLLNLGSVDEFFICGPAEMIFAISEWLQQQGVDKKKVHFELFHTQDANAANKAGAGGAGAGTMTVKDRSMEGKISQVTIKLDGNSFDFKLPYEGDSILDAALMDGADLPYACKGGVCCTCRARLVEGKVDMEVNYALEAEEVAAGFILTCQSHPRSERVVIDFDAR